MNPDSVLISQDLILIGRYFGAVIWGLVMAGFLQWHPIGQWLAREIVIVTVIVGVAGDLGISYRTDWDTVTIVIALSSIGLLIRFFINYNKKQQDERQEWQAAIARAFKEGANGNRKDQFRTNYYNVLHVIEEVRPELLALDKQVSALGKLLKTDTDGTNNARVLDIKDQISDIWRRLAFAKDGGIEK